MRGASRVVMAGALLAAIWMLGCSAVHGLNDAGPDDDIDAGDDGDGGADDPDARGPDGPVRVTVFDMYEVPEPGALILFNAPDGTALAQLIAGPDGTAEHVVPPGSSVTALRSVSDDNGTYHQMETIIGVMPGDEIEIGPRVPEPSYDFMGTLNFEFLSGYLGSTNFQILIGCDSWDFFNLGYDSIQVFESKCNRGQEPIDLVATVRDAAYEPVAYLTRTGIDLDTGDFVQIGGWQTNFASLDIHANNAPAGVVSVEGDTQVWHSGLDYGLGNPGGVPLAPGQSTTFNMRYPMALAESLHPSVQVFFGEGGDPPQLDGVSMVTRSVGVSASSVTVDLTDDMLPRVTDVQSIQQDDRSAIDFTINGEPDEITAVAAGLQWSHKVDAARTIYWEWSVVASPSAAPPLLLPEIPDGALIDPDTEENAWPPPKEAMVDEFVAGIIKLPAPSWQVFRQNRPFDFFEDPLAPDAPMGAEARFSISGMFGDFE